MLRRLLTRWLPIAALAAACSLATAAPAGAAAPYDPTCDIGMRAIPLPQHCYEPRLAGTNHVGWVYLNLNHCPAGMMCALVHRQSTSAWRWTSAGWTKATIDGGWVYVYPYSGEWRWAWTHASGWVAISGHRFEIRAY